MFEPDRGSGNAFAAVRQTAPARWSDSPCRPGAVRSRQGLRVILERCLDPVPDRRYSRARHLAEDLDRWRIDRQLAFTDEPFWGQTVPRVLRRHRRRMLLITVAFSLLIGLPLTAVVSFRSLSNLRETAQFKLARLWDDPEAGAYLFQRPQAAHLLQADGSHVEAAVRALQEYAVLGPDDWRQRDDAAPLQPSERDDLELWLMGHAYLYCRALEERPESPDDWQRAAKILADLDERAELTAWTPIRRRLAAKLRSGGSRWPISARREMCQLSG